MQDFNNPEYCMNDSLFFLRAAAGLEPAPSDYEPDNLPISPHCFLFL